MSRMRDYGTKVYIGDLPREASEREIEKVFREYGRLKNVWVARNPPGFAFVEFEDLADAQDAVRELDGTVMCGVRARVELSSGKSRQKPWLRGGARDGGRDMGGRRGKPFDPSDRCYECGERGHYAYDCRRRNGGPPAAGRPDARRRKSRSPSGRRSYSRSRSR
ncbi:Serine and arginine rich splicing factor 3 [Paragonimus heterotremus]|uniref:Serine and arginine rich splicing factor 3 n=1 Tax=Paragonimus heterotremus TaxID=100268 RepID=A0A8J4TBV8_9TREM|nr:Serine and arginine rich splicing factor 3 [Paragonimus heterotremus]